jgi:hypothetical protein
MELLCPECLGTLESRDGRSAQCAAHGGQFEILFARHPVALPRREGNLPPPLLAEGATCAQHPSVAAAHACASCGTPICPVCDFAQADGSHWCPGCAHRAAVTPPVLTPQTQLPSGVRCVQHPHLPATGQCKVCGAFMCNTCAFEMPGGTKICPACATTPQTALSAKRKKMLIGSFALAVWCTFVMGALLAGMFKSMVTTKADQDAFGFVLMVILVVPSIIGLALGLSSMDRRLHNTIAMWITTAWNGLILGGFILLVIIGLMKGG